MLLFIWLPHFVFADVVKQLLTIAGFRAWQRCSDVSFAWKNCGMPACVPTAPSCAALPASGYVDIKTVFLD